MASLELKPQHSVDRCSSVEEMHMTYPRDQVPPPLANGVSLSLWQETWDAIQSRFEAEFQLAREFRSKTLPFFFCPCFLPCLLCVFSDAHEKDAQNERAWISLCVQQNEQYEKLNITVTLITEVYAAGVGSARRFDRRNVGLKFVVHPDHSGGDRLHQSTAPTPVSGTSSIAQDLKAVAELYQKGILSEEEFGKAKAKLLG